MNCEGWPGSYFAALADLLIKELKAAVIFVGTEKQRLVIGAVRQRMRQESFDFCGKTNLKGLGALILNMNLFI